MTKPIATPADGQSLKKLLHDKIEQLEPSKLSFLNRIMMQLEAEELAESLDAGFDEDRRQGKLATERVEEIISKVRADHPYK
jgi:hypothetical protein